MVEDAAEEPFATYRGRPVSSRDDLTQRMTYPAGPQHFRNREPGAKQPMGCGPGLLCGSGRGYPC